MTSLAGRIRRRRRYWPTTLVVAGIALLGVSFALFSAALGPMVLTTFGAVIGATAFVLGVSASISAFLDRDGYGDSDFYR
jgi:uncharacterized membrane protein YhaH (DUF805 family)